MTSRGFTLLELIVVIAILAITTSVAALSLSKSLRGTKRLGASSLPGVHATAMHAGERVYTRISVRGDSIPVVILPDGRIISDSLDPFGGITGHGSP